MHEADDKPTSNDVSRLPRVPVSPGELIDKITILDLKAERMADRSKVANVLRELAILEAERAAYLSDDETVRRLTDGLRAVNGKLWDLEDAIRDCERRKDFGAAFIEAARAIYRTNDERAALKKELNLHLGSQIVEEKSYADY